MVSLETRTLFEELKKDLTLVSLHFNVFRALYADQQAVDLLNAIAPGTFWVIQDSLSYSIVLRISRLTDPPTTSRQENLTLGSLIAATKKDGDSALGQRLDEQYNEVKTQVESIRKLRHKVTVHTDRAVRLKEIPVPAVHLVEMTQSIEAIGEFLNVFSLAVNGSRDAYEQSVMNGEAEVLLGRLREAVAYRQEVLDWHLLGNPQRQHIRELLEGTQSKLDASGRKSGSLAFTKSVIIGLAFLVLVAFTLIGYLVLRP